MRFLEIELTTEEVVENAVRPDVGDQELGENEEWRVVAVSNDGQKIRLARIKK